MCKIVNQDEITLHQLIIGLFPLIEYNKITTIDVQARYLKKII